MLAGQRKRLDTVFGLQCTIAMGYEKIVEELHIEVVVLDDQHLLRYRSICPHLRFRTFERHAAGLEKLLKCRRSGRSLWTKRLGHRRSACGYSGAVLSIDLNFPELPNS